MLLGTPTLYVQSLEGGGSLGVCAGARLIVMLRLEVLLSVRAQQYCTVPIIFTYLESPIHSILLLPEELLYAKKGAVSLFAALAC